MRADYRTAYHGCPQQLDWLRHPTRRASEQIDARLAGGGCVRDPATECRSAAALLDPSAGEGAPAESDPISQIGTSMLNGRCSRSRITNSRHWCGMATRRSRRRPSTRGASRSRVGSATYGRANGLTQDARSRPVVRARSIHAASARNCAPAGASSRRRHPAPRAGVGSVASRRPERPWRRCTGRSSARPPSAR
jgi:hypothetical protein